jgi:hypothetical protein
VLNRRGFLSLLGIGAATAAIDPERLIWTPGRKLISIPAPRVIVRVNITDVLAAQIERVRPKIMEHFYTAPRYMVIKSVAAVSPTCRLSVARDQIGRVIGPGDKLSINFSHTRSQ